MGSSTGTSRPTFKSGLGPIPVSFLVILIAAAALDYWLYGSGSGLQLRSVGFDERSAKRNGVRTKWVRARALILSSAFATIAAFLVMARSSVGNAAIGESYALDSITAAVLGGAALSGGRATFLGAVVASVLLALILVVLPFLGLSSEHGLMIIGVLVLLGIVLFQVGDIKELVKRNYKRARRRVIGSRPPKVAEIPDLYPPGLDFAVVPTNRTLIRGGTVLSLDPTVGDFPSGDVLIEGDRIVEVRPGLQVDGAEVIDASGMIVMPGFVDTHRHIWEGLLRNIGTDVPLEGRSSYISFVLHKLAPAFRPEDAYVGDLVSALGAIDAGITTLLDWSHIQGSPAHTDAVIQALKDSGLRSGVRLRVPVVGQVGGAPALAGSCGPRPSTSPRRTRCSRSPWPRRVPSSPTSRSPAITGSWPGRPTPASRRTSASAATARTARSRRWARRACSDRTRRTSTAPR